MSTRQPAPAPAYAQPQGGYYGQPTTTQQLNQQQMQQGGQYPYYQR